MIPRPLSGTQMTLDGEMPVQAGRPGDDASGTLFHHLCVGVCRLLGLFEMGADARIKPRRAAWRKLHAHALVVEKHK